MRNKRKFSKTKEWLIEEYIIKNRPRKEIAEECNLSEAGLKSLLKSYNIYKEIKTVDPCKLNALVKEGKNAEEIAKFFKCSITKIYRTLSKLSLKIIAEPKKVEQYDDSKDVLICDMYLDGLSTTQIAACLGLTHSTINTHLKRCGIPLRSLAKAQWAFNNKEFPKELDNRNYLYDLYINQKKSKKEIGILHNCTPRVIDRLLKNYNIEIRGNSKCRIGKYRGKDHPNWQGGITGLHMRLREAFYKNLARKVLQRDHYKCTMCGSKKQLHVHHIKPFKELLNNILKKNANLDPIKDQDLLYNIALEDKDFNDLDNLITLCKECHLFKVHKYKKKNS